MDMVKFASSEDPGYARTLGFIAELCHAGQAAQQGGEKRENEILRILEFPSMNDRELDIEEAYADTCGWIMDDEPSNGTTNRGAPRFTSWLQNDESIFWISGKAGCGKSTLMKFVYQHSDTKAALAQWADNKKLITAGYFFLERGNDLQKSREGMIRSILHQILGKRRDLIPVAFPAQFGSHVPPTPDAVNSWKSLAAACNAVLDGLGDSKVCLFIDGLDEYRMLDKYHEYTQEQLDLIFDGAGEDASWGLSDWIVDGHKDIAAFVLEINARPNAKICLSSRELGVFEQKFRSVPRIEVHHYTAAPIKEYCEGRLVQDAPGLSDSDRANFVSLITEKSRGVFLWVRLVVNMLIDGSAAGDTLGELLKTLESLPVRLGGRNGLYMRMMQNVQPRHLPEAARLFQLVRYWDSTNLQGHLDIITLFAAQEGHLETDGGGLRVQKDKIAPKVWEDLRGRWTGLQQRLKSRCGGLLEGTEDVQFMHQTAKEFVSRAYLWDHIFSKHRGFVTDSEKKLAILSGLIRRLKCCGEAALVARVIQSSEQSLPIIESHSTDSMTTVCTMLSNCFSVARRLESVEDTIDNYEQLMDELLITGDYLTRPQGTDSDTTAQPCGKWIEIFLEEDSLEGIDLKSTSPWDLMIGLGCHHYVITKVKGKGIPLAQLQQMLRTASKPFKTRWRSQDFGGWVPPQPEIVAALFGEGADPNSKLDETDDPDSGSHRMDKRDESAEPLVGLTVWTSLLRNVYQEAVRSETSLNHRFIIEHRITIQHFLDNGADRIARFHDADGIERTLEEVMEVIEVVKRGQHKLQRSVAWAEVRWARRSPERY
ncbi:hypothetical protein B0T18DRAFT_469409 [Schizothecium vesticola]|uniref:Nephrocystin 3-like N-terminal domain-containing protein n=1 Tax=Schizothecium vesticola TaxID=314040 RepID=A0AA40EQT5_9PEZI|nr:hypothetical protein B0T18DRAFT_469409 [Schizothecium vesticola]